MKINPQTKVANLLVTAFLTLQSICLFAWQLQPDLIVVESALRNSLDVDSVFNVDPCYVNEGCLGDTGHRQVIKFTTQISNVGNADFYAGEPPALPDMSNDIWTYDGCHEHYHYDNYAEYVLLDEYDNIIPAGFKTGFCLADIFCEPGYEPVYTCRNQGISAHCTDVYSSGLPCQWVDVTDLPAGVYKLSVKVNYREEPDLYGIYESTYANNSAEVCFELFRNAMGKHYINKLSKGTGCVSEACYETTLTIRFDGFAYENSWQLYTSDNILLYSSNGAYLPSLSNTTISKVFCLPEDCYTFTFHDTGNDGLCCESGNGGYKIYNSSGIFLLDESPQEGNHWVSQFCISPPDSISCTDLDGDGICVENDCNDNDTSIPGSPGAACNDNDPNTIHDEIQADGCSCAGIVDNNCTVQMSLLLHFDNFPFETSWEIQNANGDVVDFTSSYVGYAGYSSTAEDICLKSGCYTLIIKDSFGDGMCCNAGNGAYQLTNIFNEVVAKGATFTDSISHSFCVAPCESDLYIGDVNNTITFYKVSNSLTGVGEITGNNATVTFSANQRVELKTGFKVKEGSTFRADNEGCGN